MFHVEQLSRLGHKPVPLVYNAAAIGQDRLELGRQSAMSTAINGVARPSTAPSAAGQVAGQVAPGRLVSLDVFRGLTIAGMILVNNPGTWSAIYWPLEHAQWHGWTPTDLIFPFFLFIVGVSMVLSFNSRRQRGATQGKLLLHVLRRSAIIFAIGFFLAAYPRFNMATVRIPGVLQRIAVVYLLSSLVVLYLGRRGRAMTIMSLLLGYWAVMMLVPVPGFGAGDLSMDGNLAGFIDRKLMLHHLYIKERFDPEGVLSTFPAIATALLGAFLGEWLRSGVRALDKLKWMLAGGLAAVVVGRLWGIWFPINKNLWTSSYVLFTAGLAAITLGVCYWLVDIKRTQLWARPFLWLGMNAITVFALSSFLAKCMGIYRVNVDGQQMSWKALVYQRGFAQLAQPVNASLLFALAYLLLFVVLAWTMYRTKIFIKV